MQKKLDIPKIIGHRGVRGQAPENTLVGFNKAKELGATWVEFDVQATRDQVLVVAHDEELDRTSNGHGRLVDTTWDQLKQLDAGSWFAPEFANEKIPTFAETIQLLSQLGLAANVEIKPHDNDVPLAIAVAKMIQEKWPSNIPPPLVSSFSMEALRAARATNPELIIGALFEVLPPDWLQVAKQLQASTINLDHTIITPELMREISNEHYPVLAYTVNDKKRAVELFAMGVTAIFTDYLT